MKLEHSQKFFEKFLNIKFHENPSSKRGVVPCGRTDRRTDMKLIVVFCNFANVPKKEPFLLTSAIERLGGISVHGYDRRTSACQVNNCPYMRTWIPDFFAGVI